MCIRDSYNTWSQSYGSTGDMEAKYKELNSIFGAHYTKIKDLKGRVEQMESKAEGYKMPSTFGRLPEWK